MDKAKKRKAVKISLVSVSAVIFILLVAWIIWSNITFDITRIESLAPSLPDDFEGFKIAQISDLHNADYGNGNRFLLDILRAENPDIIAITGDIIDSPQMENALEFVKEAQKTAPCYYVTGNHEAWIEDDIYELLEAELITLGVTVLHNEAVTVQKNGAEIRIVGIDDPDFDENSISLLGELCSDNVFTVLLSHRPELFEEYVCAGAELVLSGHAHGGQFRIPFIGGVYAPHQGVLPKYDAGLYTDGDTNMYVSRGIGNSDFPVRINNRPEIVFIELTAKAPVPRNDDSSY